MYFCNRKQKKALQIATPIVTQQYKTLMQNRYFASLLATLAFTAASAQDTTPTIIANQPEGTLMNLYRSTTGFEAFFGNAMTHESNGDRQRMVIGNDGAFYLENPINSLFSQTWIKGYATTNDTIAFQLPQVIYSEEFGGTVSYGYLQRMVPTENGRSYAVDPTSQTLKYVWRDNHLTKVDDNASYIIGMCLANGSWAGYGEEKYEAYVLEDNTEKPSPTADVRDGLMLYMTLDGATQQYPVKYGIDGNTAWLGNLSANMKDHWVKGEFKDGECIFPTTSYLGIDTISGGYMYLSSVNFKRVGEDTQAAYDSVYVVDDPIVFTYKAETNTWASRGAMAVHKSVDDLRSTHVLDYYRYGQIDPWVNTVAAPLPAIFTNYMPYDDMFGYGGVEFMLSYYSEDGNYLDPSHLYYDFYIDGERQTFAYPDYINVPSAMTDVPFAYSDQYDFYKLSDNDRRIYFYKDPKTSLGIESLYIDGDTRLTVGVTEYFLNTDGIATSPVSTKRSVSVEYTDLQGRRVNRPTKGIYVRTVTFDDGTKESKKIVE